ncbi:MAG: EAL domain-containing protein, partial [Ruminiclostridium sp.]|nr:EAL domain-containing protein [Ruminiclostridium sp.]
MSNTKVKHFRNIKKSHAWVSILLFVLVSIITTAFIGIAGIVFGYYIIDSKVYDEYKSAVYLADLYDTAGGNEDIYPLLDASGRHYFITGTNGELLHITGKDTTDDTEGTIRLSSKAKNVRIIKDAENGTFFVGSDNIINFDLGLFFSMFRSKEARDTADELDEEELIVELADSTEIVALPFWIAEDVNGGVLTVKSYLVFSMRDIILILAFTVILLLLFTIMFIIMLVNFINGITHRRKTLNVFFTDIVTGGHNWMWFIIKGGEMLKKRRNRPNRYAVINLAFVNYRIFCVCHSVEQGEQMLREIHRVLRSMLTKREMCAHCSSSDFAAIIQFTDRDALERRVQTIINALKNINSDHTFTFHAGISIVEPDGTPDSTGAPSRRKDLDMETVYNNACTAQSSLDGSDEAGIAFFDSKLVEDQKWIDTVREHQQSALNNEEFMVYYQPKYDPRTDELRGAEALIRWQSPEFG